MRMHMAVQRMTQDLLPRWETVCLLLVLASSPGMAQSGWPLYRIPDTGQTTHATATSGEDADYTINAPSYTIGAGVTVIDNVTGLMWQRSDGGEMTSERAGTYCDTLTLGGYTDWRVPTSRELFGILHHDRLNPALDTTVFTATAAEYWWASETRADGATRVWAANAGGGIGAHLRTETIGAGGTKRFHVRAVRNIARPMALDVRLRDNGDGTVTDRTTGLTWQKTQPAVMMSWENALVYAETLSLAGRTDWRLPNIKELQSLNDPSVVRPFAPRWCLRGPRESSGHPRPSSTQRHARGIWSTNSGS